VTWKREIWRLFLKSPKTVRVPQFPLYLCNAKVLSHPLGFSYIKNMLKDRLFKTGGLQFDNWLLRPQRVLRTFEKQAQETCLSLQHFVINFSDKQVKVMEIYFHLSRTELTHISITVGSDI